MINLPSGVQQAVLELEAQLETPIEFDEHGIAHLLIDDHAIISLRYNTEQESYELYGFLPSIPDAEMQHMALEMLNANFLWRETWGATLGRDAATGQCALCFRIPAEGFSGESLLNLLGEFSDRVDTWASRVVSHTAGQVNSEASPSLEGEAGKGEDFATAFGRMA